MITLKCKNCEKPLPLKDFKKSEITRTNPFCRYCARRFKNRRRTETKRKIVEHLNGCCAICGYKTQSAVSLSIDHRNPFKKTTKESSSRIVNWGWDRIIEEIEKGECWLLCLNCHAETEYYRQKERIRNGLPANIDRK